MNTQRASGGVALIFLWPWHKEGMDGQCHAPTALSPVKRHGTRCSSVSSVVFGNGLDGYGKSRLNWHSNAESCSTQTVAMPNTLPRPSIFGAVSNKSSYYSVDCLLSEHSCVIRFGLPSLLNLFCHLSLCQIYDYILNCHVSFMKWSNLYLFKLWAFRIISEGHKILQVITHDVTNRLSTPKLT